MNPWDRRPGESAPAFAAFTSYRDMGPDRSIRLVARKCNKSASMLGRWSAKHAWLFRAEQWDDHLRRLAEAEFRRLAGEDAARMLTVVRAGEALVAKSVGRALEALDDKDRVPSLTSVITSLELIVRLRHFVEGTTRERMEHGRPGLASSSAREELVRRLEELGQRIRAEEASA